MSFYSDRILPHVIHLAMRQETFTTYRQRLVHAAEGRVLEIGAGPGLNLPFYSAQVTSVLALDPSPKLIELGRGRAVGNQRVLWIEAAAEAIPLDDRSIDTVLTSWTLCSVWDVVCALDEVRRVLKASGKLLFVEHGRAPDSAVRRWQDRLTPVWRRVAGGCHLNRPVDRLIEDSGFVVENLRTGYMQGPRVLTFMYEGCARPK